jgi:hypothetical protein
VTDLPEGFQRRQLDQPDLANFDAVKLAIPQEASQILDATRGEFSGGFD